MQFRHWVYDEFFGLMSKLQSALRSPGVEMLNEAGHSYARTPGCLPQFYARSQQSLRAGTRKRSVSDRSDCGIVGVGSRSHHAKTAPWQVPAAQR